MFASPKMKDASPGSQAFIEWYDSPKVLLRTQTKQLRRSVQLMKTGSVEELSSPSLSSLSEIRSTQDLSRTWLTSSPKENCAPFQEDSASTSAECTLSSQRVPDSSQQATPHRRIRSARLVSRERRSRPKNDGKTEKEEENSEMGLSMEEGLAIGKASLAKMRQRLNSGDDADVGGATTDSDTQLTPANTTSMLPPTLSPISSLDVLKKKSETMMTPSLARSKQRFSTSTPKSSTTIAATPLKRFWTMDDNTVFGGNDSAKEKIKRTRSLDVTNDESNDDSFLDEVFIPFENSSQLAKLLNRSQNQTDKSPT